MFEVELAGARAAFTTRDGGSSTGPYAGLNLGILTDDDPARVRANGDALARELGVELAWAKQVHGAEVITVDGPNDPGAAIPEADGLATATPGVGVLVLAADCLPIAIAGGGAVGIVHAGWPGLAAGVIARGVAAVGALAAPHAPLTAAVGPGAGGCCYQVGPELHERFAGYGPQARHGDKLDLKLIARRQLEAAGIAEVHDVGVCTICSDPSLLFSHRRDRGVTGRQAGIAWLS